MIRRLEIATNAAVAELSNRARRFDQLVSKPALIQQRDDIRRAASQLRLVTQLTAQGTYDLDDADAWLWAADATLDRYVAIREQARS